MVLPTTWIMWAKPFNKCNLLLSRLTQAKISFKRRVWSIRPRSNLPNSKSNSSSNSRIWCNSRVKWSSIKRQWWTMPQLNQQSCYRTSYCSRCASNNKCWWSSKSNSTSSRLCFATLYNNNSKFWVHSEWTWWTQRNMHRISVCKRCRPKTKSSKATISIKGRRNQTYKESSRTKSHNRWSMIQHINWKTCTRARKRSRYRPMVETKLIGSFCRKEMMILTRTMVRFSPLSRAWRCHQSSQLVDPLLLVHRLLNYLSS